MIRLIALNDDTSRSSEEYDIHPKEPPQEVQEENALKVYNEALQEQRCGNVEKAEELYKQLLSSNLLMKVKIDEENIKAKPDTISSVYSKPTHMLKYSCLKNLAVIFQKKNLLNEALEYYMQALEVEGTDVSIWYQTGCVAMLLLNIRTALEAFLKVPLLCCQGLEFSSKHWPSLDKLIICLFTLNDYVNCLYFISKAFELDIHYTRGQVLRDYILTEQPSLQNDIQLFFPNIDLHINEKNNEKQEKKDFLLREVLKVRNEYNVKHKSSRPNNLPLECFVPVKQMKSVTWSDLGENLLLIQEDLTNQEEPMSLLTVIGLKSIIPKNQPCSDMKSEPTPQVQSSSESTHNKFGIEENAKEKQNNGAEKKSKKNRGSTLMEELLWGGKRRSARVRSSLRGNPEPMDVAEALRRTLPRKLLHKTKQLKIENSSKGLALEENSMDTMDLYRLFEKQESAEEKRIKEELERCEVEHDIDKIVESEGYFGTCAENTDVLSFIDSLNEKNITEILKAYIISLESHWKKTWPNSLPNVYIKCYQLMRSYHPLDFKMCTSESNFKNLVEESGCILLYGELYLEHSSNIRNKSDQRMDSNLQISFLQKMMALTDSRDLFESDEKYFEFLVRLYWLRCRIFLANGQTSLAIIALNDVLACYELFPQFQTKVIDLKNCRKHNVISNKITEELLAYQSRKRSLAEVVRLYEDESYQELTDILKETFTTTSDTASYYFKEQESELVDRQTQLAMLINGLYHLNEYKECIYWLETCCYEILQKSSIQALVNEVVEESWMVAFDRFLMAIEDCLKLGNTTITESLPPNRVSRFVQTLCHAVCKELEDSDRPPCPARPWIMLNSILIGMEAQEKGEIKFDEDEEDENDIPSSILILFTAHEYLGRREWCNCNESVLLFLIMDQVIPQIRNPEWSSFRETIQQHLEQVVYCLYSHPSKKNKARYLTDHNVNSISLTWERGIQLFDLFRPDETPAYDSLRINLISSDTEALFRRIAALIPDEKDPNQISDQMMDFIVGKRNDVPVNNVKLPEIAQDLFYILGDYFFKTHEFGKAVKYLLMDLCANPDRVDSWASMALSRASILEQQLNSCDPLKDEIFLQDALSALRCYEHCLQLDNKQCALWIEYGSFVYTIHSFCSQRMKLESDSLSLEQFEELESTKNKMLDTAKQAFLNANLIWYEMKEENDRQDERWLHHYMLGKICEKNGDLNYFEHYEKAADLLYENEAEFPTKVGYNTPQTLAIEALEVYYRIHVCVIKALELNEGKPLDPKTKQLFNKHLNLCAKGPFAKQLSKGDLAKMKAKELEAAQNEKNINIIKSVLNDIIFKIEIEENHLKEMSLEKEVKEEVFVENETKIPVVEVTEISLISAKESDKEIEEIEIIDDQIETSSVELIEVDEKPKIMEKKEKSLIEVEKLDLGKKDFVLEVKKEEKLVDDAGDPQKKILKIAEIVANEHEQEQIMMPLALDFRDYKHSENPSDNYYLTLEDIKNMRQIPSKVKKKRRLSQASISSSSCGSEEIRYDDDSSSSSSSSESSVSSQSSSSSSSDSSESDVTNKETKVTDEEEKAHCKGKEKTAESESGVEEKEETSDEGSNSSENNMLKRCLAAFETCALRFPQHYKSVYRLAHFYYRSKEHRDITKCRDLLLGRYQTPNGTISGLFADKKTTNFFNGIWRIPAGDVDRPGSFASHMSRSILLLMAVLRDLKDHKMLLEICIQLKRTPEPDKKYLREDERNQLFVQACNLTIQTLRKNVKECLVMNLPMVLDCYRCYQKVQKHYSTKESIFGDILLEAFKRLGKGDKCSLEQAVRFCQSEISSAKIKTPKNLNPTQVVIPKPKPVKLKKTEKKKSTPKPQITAKVVQKAPKIRKPYEKKKITLNVPMSNATESFYWQTLLKSTAEPRHQETGKSGLTSSQVYTEFLKTSAATAKHREQLENLEKKISDQIAFKNVFDQIRSSMNPNSLIREQSGSPGYFPYQNYPVDYGSNMYKQFMNNYWFNNAFAGGFFNHVQNIRKNKSKVVKPKSVLKTKAVLVEPSKPDDNKAKTNFNIEDILGKPTKLPLKPQPFTSTLSKAVEDKIKSISGEVNVTKCSTSHAINLSTNRKNQMESGKRIFLDNPDSAVIKKICQRPEPSAVSTKSEIEVVVIDD